MPDHVGESIILSRTFQKACHYIQDYVDDVGEKKKVVLDNRRIACTYDGVIAISGEKDVTPEKRKAEAKNPKFRAIQFAEECYGVDISSMEMRRRFTQIIQKYQVTKQENWDIDNCAEASLWMTLEALQARTEGPGQSPRHLHTHRKNQRIWVFQIDRKHRPKPDSPCKTCQQWARSEFLTINGTNWH